MYSVQKDNADGGLNWISYIKLDLTLHKKYEGLLLQAIESCVYSWFFLEWQICTIVYTSREQTRRHVTLTLLWTGTKWRTESLVVSFSQPSLRSLPGSPVRILTHHTLRLNHYLPPHSPQQLSLPYRHTCLHPCKLQLPSLPIMPSKDNNLLVLEMIGHSVRHVTLGHTYTVLVSLPVVQKRQPLNAISVTPPRRSRVPPHHPCCHHVYYDSSCHTCTPQHSTRWE